MQGALAITQKADSVVLQDREKDRPDPGLLSEEWLRGLAVDSKQVRRQRKNSILCCAQACVLLSMHPFTLSANQGFS